MSNDSTAAGYLSPTSTAPADDLSLDAVFQTLFVGVTGLPGPLVRPRWQTTVPQEPDVSVTWCAVGITSVKADNPAIRHNPADAGGLGTDTLYRHELIEVLASFYGPTGQQTAELARDGLWVERNNSTLAPFLTVFTGETDSIRSVPELINQQWRRRYDFTCWFRRQVIRSYGIRNLVACELDLYTDNGEVASAIVLAH
jgi:hypothetical protein